MRRRKAAKAKKAEPAATQVEIRDEESPELTQEEESASTTPESGIAVESPATEEDRAELGDASEEESVTLEEHQRLLAEFDNFRKRMELQRTRYEQWGKDSVLTRLLPILDDVARAKSALTCNPDQFGHDGILIILGRLAEALKQEGLNEIEASPGVVFDPEVHEAVLTIPTADVAEGLVAEILEAGYRSGDRLLRPAKVAVARAPEQELSAEDPDGG